MARDLVAAAVDFLKADADLSALVAGLDGITPVVRVYGEELPGAEAISQPRPAVIVRAVAGGEPVGGYVELHRQALEVWCLGATAEGAMEVNGAAYQALKHARRQVVQGTLVHSFEESAAPRALRDPDTGWPVVVTGWTMLAAEVQAE